MVKRSHEGSAGEPVTSRTQQGSAVFRRSGPTSAELELEYHVPGFRAELRGGPLAEGIEALCEAEIEMMRTCFQQLGVFLAAQLSDAGKRPKVEQDMHSNDQRKWRDRKTFVEVAPSSTRTKIALNGYEGAADAQLVLATVGVAIQQREQDIRKLYAKILADARVRRGESAPEANA